MPQEWRSVMLLVLIASIMMLLVTMSALRIPHGGAVAVKRVTATS